MLGDGKCVSIRVLKPSDLVAIGRNPDSEIVLLKESETFEVKTSFLQECNYLFDLRYIPAQNRILHWRELLRFDYPDHDAVRVEDQRKLVIIYEGQPQHSFVKSSGLGTVFSWNESDDVRCPQHKRP